MKKEIIGHVTCPVCPHENAEVKEDKNAHAFIFCPDCATQVFTRNAYRDSHLRKRMRPVTVTVTEPLPTKPAEQPVTKPSETPVPAAKVRPAIKPVKAKENPAPVDPAPLPPKKSGGWFSPLLGGGA